MIVTEEKAKEAAEHPKTDLVSHRCPFKGLCMETNQRLKDLGKWAVGDQRPMSCFRCDILGIRLGQSLPEDKVLTGALCLDCVAALRQGGAVVYGQSGDCTHIEISKLTPESVLCDTCRHCVTSLDVHPHEINCDNCPDEHAEFWENGTDISKSGIYHCTNYEKRIAEFEEVNQ